MAAARQFCEMVCQCSETGSADNRVAFPGEGVRERTSLGRRHPGALALGAVLAVSASGPTRVT